MKNQPLPPDSINVEIYHWFDDETGEIQYHLEDIVHDFRQKLIEIGAISQTEHFTLFNTKNIL